nr:galectin-10 [Saimiri boliviensis boliviensis]
MSLLTVPYKQPVSLHIGSSVTIKGKPVQPFINQPRLQVDFHTAQGDVSDIAFRFQVCFGYYVAMNSRENGAWKQEVKSKNMPFEDGKEFELCISVQDNVYQVMVNGQFSYTFDHRLPQGSVKMVQVWGDISLTSMGPKLRLAEVRLEGFGSQLGAWEGSRAGAAPTRSRDSGSNPGAAQIPPTAAYLCLRNVAAAIRRARLSATAICLQVSHLRPAGYLRSSGKTGTTRRRSCAGAH